METLRPLLFLIFTIVGIATGPSQDQPPMRVLMLGDAGHHRPSELAKLLIPALAQRGIAVEYTEDTAALSEGNLTNYRALLFYLNTEQLAPSAERALLTFIENGGGLAALHCASAAFGNSEKYTSLIGGRFASHGTGVFRTRIIDAQHPAMRGFAGFESFDETYMHSKIANDIEVLTARVDGARAEPWTWARAQGRGRVFYTASGHDERTWREQGFVDLVARGVLWAGGEMKDDAPNLTYDDIKIPAEARDGGETLRIPRPLSPADSMKRMHLPEGFEVELVASEPNIIKPISMSFDPYGRLWVVESVDYPNRVADMNKPGNDRIKLCEDTNADGTFDRFTIFAGGMNLPQSIQFVNGGAVVARSPEIIFMKDANGAGAFNETRVLYQGFGRGDTHAMHGNFSLGPDGWIYATCGYSGLSVVSAGIRYNSAQCLFRFRADRDGFEVLTPTTNNTWGIGMNESFDIFGSTANGLHALFLAIPNRFFESVRGWHALGNVEIENHKWARPVTKDIRQVDFNGGFTAASGFTIYTDTVFPREYQNQAAFVCEPTMHLIHADLLERTGSGYVANDFFNIMASSDPWCAPIQSTVGPDGALYFIDWYNYIVQHNPTPQHYKTGKGNAYITPLRDESHGRIYRIVNKKGAKYRPPILAYATTETLVKTLAHESQFWRSQAQRRLVENCTYDASLRTLLITKAVDPLLSLWNDPGAPAVSKIHILYTLSELEVFQQKEFASHPAARIFINAMSNADANVRKTAVRVAPRDARSLEAILQNKLLEDPDPAARLAAFLAISEVPPGDHANEMSLGAYIYELSNRAENVTDRWIPLAATAAAAAHPIGYLTSAARINNIQKEAGPRQSVLANGSVDAPSGDPAPWKRQLYSGAAKLSVYSGRDSQCLKIESTAGADAGWICNFNVARNTTYRLSGWIKTENVDAASGHGALFNIHELQSPRIVTNAIVGTRDWSFVQTTFDSGEHENLSVNALFGGWGQSRGAAWYDNIRVEEMGKTTIQQKTAEIVAKHCALGASPELPENLPAILTNNRASADLLSTIADHWPASAGANVSIDTRKFLLACAEGGDPKMQSAALRLSTTWKIDAPDMDKIRSTASEKLIKTYSDPAAGDDRLDALRQWLAMDTNRNFSDALSAIRVSTPADFAGRVFDILRSSPSDDLSKEVVLQLPFWPPSIRTLAFDLLLSRPRWTLQLLDAVERGEVSPGDLTLAQSRSLATHSDPNIIKRASALLGKKGGVQNADREQIVKSLLSLTKETGDARAGAAVFKQNCSACHLYQGIGNKVGPDLNGVMNGNREEILTHILDPNRSVEANYRQWILLKKDGQVAHGLLTSETQTSFELIDSTGKKQIVPRSEIEDLRVSELSLMPLGFELLARKDLIDLLEHLTGK